MHAVQTVPNPETAGRSGPDLGEQAIKVLDGFVFVGMLAVIVLVAIPYAGVQPWWIAAFECGVFALAAVSVIQGAFGQRWEMVNGALLAPIVALVCFAFFQTLPLWGTPRRAISNDPYQTRLWILFVGSLLIAAAILLRYTSTYQRLDYLVTVVIAVGVLSAIFGLTRHAMHVNLPIQGFLPPSAQGTYAQFINRNHFAMLMEMSLGLVAGVIVAAGIRRVYLASFVIAAAILWVALVLSNSRGGILAMLGQSLFLVLFLNVARTTAAQNIANGKGLSYRLGRLMRRSFSRAFLAVSLVTVLGAGVLWVGGDSLMHRLEILPLELTTDSATRQNSTRLAIWQATLRMVREHPVAGIGFGGYRVTLPQYHDASGRWIPQEAHNDYLELVASGGLVAAVLMLVFVGLLVKFAKRCLLTSSDPFRRASCFGALLGLSGVAIHSFVDFGLHTTLNAVVCVALIVIATRPITSAERTTGLASY